MKTIHIGLGGRGRHWLEVVQDCPDVVSVGCVDPNAAALAWVRARFPHMKDACYEKPAQAFRDIAADAVIIASPPALHASQAIAALEAGLAVLVDTPFATSLSEAAEIVKVARRVERTVMEAQYYRYAPNQLTLHHLVREGRVGTITHVSCSDRRSSPTQGSFLAQTDYAQLLDVGAYHLDSLRTILGLSPVSVIARCSKVPWSGYQHGSTTAALLQMEHNVHIQYYGSLTSNRNDHALWIEGDRGVLRTDRSRLWWRKRGWRFFLPVRTYRARAGDALEYSRESTMTLLNQLKTAVVEKRPPTTNGKDHLWSSSMIEAVMLSDKTGKAVCIAELLHSYRDSLGCIRQ
jgi:predicted dehydrogenase